MQKMSNATMWQMAQQWAIMSLQGPLDTVDGFQHISMECVQLFSAPVSLANIES